MASEDANVYWDLLLFNIDAIGIIVLDWMKGDAMLELKDHLEKLPSSATPRWNVF